MVMSDGLLGKADLAKARSPEVGFLCVIKAILQPCLGRYMKFLCNKLRTRDVDYTLLPTFSLLLLVFIK